MTTKKPYDSRTADRFMIRFPEGSRSKLQQLARSRFTSMNTIAVEAIERYIDAVTSTEVQVPVTEGMYVFHKNIPSVVFQVEDIKYDNEVRELVATVKNTQRTNELPHYFPLKYLTPVLL